VSLLFGKRVPWFLRTTLTASSVLAGVLFASAFSYGAPGPVAALKSPAQVSVTALPDAHSAQLRALAASKAHQDHLSHLGKLKAVASEAHLAVLQAQARKIVIKVKPRLKPVLRTSAPAVASPPKTSTVSVASAAPATTYKGSGSMQQCIISRESGGNPNAMNASGHYGLYQFSYSTWVGSGGNGADFGHASVAEQNQVFANAVAARGYSDWAPYDGC
jgi:hypothetical protein